MSGALPLVLYITENTVSGFLLSSWAPMPIGQQRGVRAGNMTE